MAERFAEYPLRFTFNENDYPGRVMAIRSTITDRNGNCEIAKTLNIPVDSITKLPRQIME